MALCNCRTMENKVQTLGITREIRFLPELYTKFVELSHIEQAKGGIEGSRCSIVIILMKFISNRQSIDLFAKESVGQTSTTFAGIAAWDSCWLSTL